MNSLRKATRAFRTVAYHSIIASKLVVLRTTWASFTGAMPCAEPVSVRVEVATSVIAFLRLSRVWGSYSTSASAGRGRRLGLLEEGQALHGQPVAEQVVHLSTQVLREEQTRVAQQQPRLARQVL